MSFFLCVSAFETQREKDQLDPNDRTHKLKLDLEGKIERLERRAVEADWSRNRRTKPRSDTSKASLDIEATTDFLAVGVCLLSFRSLNLVSHIHLYLGRGGVGYK
jgi:hypothetical protein